jgi:hypothetical protein
MRRVSGSILMVACAVCLLGIALRADHHGEWLIGPAIVFFGMAIYQFSRGSEDDRALK